MILAGLHHISKKINILHLYPLNKVQMINFKKSHLLHLINVFMIRKKNYTIYIIQSLSNPSNTHMTKYHYM